MADSGRRAATQGRRRRRRGESVRDGAGDGSLASQANENEERKKSKDGAKTPKRATLQKVL